MNLPAPGPAYDRNNEAQTRAAIQAAFNAPANLAVALRALQASTTFANDAAAAAGGVAIGALYRNGSVVQIRIA